MSLTTHVLDLTSGRPAAGMRIALSRPGAPAGAAVVVITNADGRTDAPLLATADLIAGRYELTYAVGDYFGSQSTADTSAAIPYLDIVPMHFGVAAGTERLHVALLVTPWSYTTYRGS